MCYCPLAGCGLRLRRHPTKSVCRQAIVPLRGVDCDPRCGIHERPGAAIVPLRGVDCDRQLPDGVLRAARVIVPLRGVDCDYGEKKQWKMYLAIVPLRGVDCDGKAAQIQPRFFVQVHQKHRCYL